MKRMTCWVLVAAVLPVFVLRGQVPNETATSSDSDPSSAISETPLFSSDEVLEFTLTAPFKEIFKDRDEESTYHPATVMYLNPDGESVTLDLKVRTRGIFRLNKRNCNFPPLRLNFPKKKVEGTLFEGQDKIKLVTHCQDKKDDYQQYVLEEYLIYRTYNHLTDLSFRVRLAEITYVDSEGERDTLTKYSFLIEDEDIMATRNGWESLDVPMVGPGDVDQQQLCLVEVLQYMVGNTDFSVFMLHNTKLVGNMAGPVYPVAYDFDFSGAISTKYASPDPNLPIRRVRDRLFRGICRPEEELEAVLVIFRENKDDIYALYQNQVGLEPKRLEKVMDYFDDFYETINDPKKVKREMIDDCRPV